MRMSKLAVVVPAYNEGEGLREFHARLAAVFDKLDLVSQVLYVDDGSRDGTAEIAGAILQADTDSRLTLITGAERPPGWSGKLWALQQGITASTGPIG